jgi:formylglycine-generating enzyme required for sulfatase activity
MWSKALLACALGACACLGGVLLWPGVAGSQGESPWPALLDPGAPQGGGEKDAALIVGIENYFVVEDVPGAHANALEWHTFLRENKKVPYVKWLKNEEGTRENMEAQLDETLKRVKPGGKLWFIYVGHGAPLDGGKDGGLVGVDGQQNAVSIQARSLPREVLLQKIQRQGVPAVVVLDACFSGRAQTGASLAPGLQPLVPVKGLDSGKVLLLTAAGSDQYAGPLPGAKRPAFSYLALGALRGWADQDGDGKVTGSEVRQYTDDTLSQLLNDRNQTPQMSGYDAVLSSGRGLEGGPSLSKVMGSLGSGGGSSQGGNVGGDSGGFGGGGVAVKPPKVEEPWSAGGGVASIEIVEFASQPSGLPVTVNGKVLCQSTPCSKELPVGTYQVSMGGDCVESREESVRVLASKGASVDWKLPPKMAGVEVRAYDQDDNALRATVYVDGQKVGQAPGTFTVSACSKSLEVKLDGYTTHSASLSLRERQTSSVKALLKSSSGGGGSNAGMVRVPAGKFTRGSNSDGSDEKPMREIYLSEYWIDTYEVTVDQYRACVDAGKCSKPDTGTTYCSGEWADRNNWTQNRGKHPVNCVSWTQADQYCRWAGKRLPTEAQWEKAARGTDGRTYPWGEAVPGSDGREYGNFADASAKQKWSGWSVISGYDDGWATSSPVGSFEVGKSPYGAHDMSGNVWEWVSDWYSSDAYQSAPERDPEGPKSGSKRVFRGGSFNDLNVSWLRAADRVWGEPASVDNVLGFRCARSLH